MHNKQQQHIHIWSRSRTGAEEVLGAQGPVSALSHSPTSNLLRRPQEGELMVSIDIFAPEYYNDTMGIQEKALFAESGVAFPEAVQDVAEWGKMGATEFMKKYDDVMLNLYQRPTAEELEEERLRREAEDGADERETDLEDSDNEQADQPDMDDDDV
ncbi:hypothetical protein C8F01DRAFT_1094220 [Mycena amicta]|nr:hypothetical protein C8F01DRAFT_1094220 [Mycena amicta]